MLYKFYILFLNKIYNYKWVMKMTIGMKLIELRKKSNLTQEKVADKIGVSRQTLANWENDITSPDLKQAYLLSNIFKISLDELTNNQIEISCKDNSDSILSNLIGKICYLDVDEDDFRLNYNTPCQVLDINNSFIKIKFDYCKKSIIKLIDLDLVASIRCVEKRANK